MNAKVESGAPMVIEKSIISSTELKDYLHIGNDTLNDWRAKGLKAYRLNRRIFYFLEDIKDFMRNFEV